MRALSVLVAVLQNRWPAFAAGTVDAPAPITGELTLEEAVHVFFRGVLPEAGET